MLAPTQESKAVQSPKKTGASFALGVILFGLVLAFAYSFAVERLHRKAQFAETNFQANLLRLGEFLHGKNASGVVLVGSSMGARLQPKFFPKLAPVNISLDGSSARMGMSFVLKAEHPARLVLVEENTITRPTAGNDGLLLEALQEPQMRAAGWIPFLRAAYRPSSIVYSAMKQKTDVSRGAPASTPEPGGTAVECVVNPVEAAPTPALSTAANVANSNRELREAVEMIRALQAQGTKVLIYRLPMGRPHPQCLVQQALPEVPFVNVEAELAAVGHVPLYSDGMHLASPSAQAAAQVLEKAVAAYNLLPELNGK